MQSVRFLDKRNGHQQTDTSYVEEGMQDLEHFEPTINVSTTSGMYYQRSSHRCWTTLSVLGVSTPPKPGKAGSTTALVVRGVKSVPLLY